MALQVRRGTNAERLSITPLAGELIYVTDTKQLYIGDGSTVGGTTTIAGTIDSLLADTSPQLGGNLDLNSFNITGTGNIDIAGTITATGTINLGDGVGDDVINLNGVISGHLLPQTDTTWNIGAPTFQFKEAWISQLNVENQINANRINGSLLADDSTVVFDALTGTLNANALVGTFTGDVTGSIFGDDSSLLVDAVNNNIVGRIRSSESIEVTTYLNNTGFKQTGLAEPGAIGPSIVSNSSNGTLITPTALVGGTNGDGMLDIRGQGYDGTAYSLAGIIRVAVDLDSTVAPGVVPGRVMFITAGANGVLQNLLIFNSQGRLGLGTPRPSEKLHVANGNAKIDGFVQFGSLTTTDRNALTAAAGMVIWNSTTTQFEGFNGTNWIDLVSGAISV